MHFNKIFINNLKIKTISTINTSPTENPPPPPPPPVAPTWVTVGIGAATDGYEYDSGPIIATNGHEFDQIMNDDSFLLNDLGLTLTSSDGSCRITGTPNTPVEFYLTIRATNQNLFTDKNFILTINSQDSGPPKSICIGPDCPPPH